MRRILVASSAIQSIMNDEACRLIFDYFCIRRNSDV